MKIKVTSKGQVTLPGALRKQLNINEGDYLDARIHNNSLLLKLVPRQNDTEIIREYCKKYNDKNVTLEQTRQILGKVPFSIAERAGRLREE